MNISMNQISQEQKLKECMLAMADACECPFGDVIKAYSAIVRGRQDKMNAEHFGRHVPWIVELLYWPRQASKIQKVLETTIEKEIGTENDTEETKTRSQRSNSF